MRKWKNKLNEKIEIGIENLLQRKERQQQKILINFIFLFLHGT